MSYEINVLVNGNRCRQYPHNGKLFVEAKQGSEYSIEIKNNTWQRILAVSSVDGLDVLSGKSATEDGNGYVINGYSSLKIDGFRVSNEKVARFLFDYKGGSYAASKEDGSERNVGVVGVRIFTEKVKPPPPPTIIREEHHHHHDHYKYPPYRPWWDRPGRPYWDDTTIWCGGLTSSTLGTSCNASNDATRGDIGDDELHHLADDVEYERGAEKYSCDDIPVGASGTKSSSSDKYTKGLRRRGPSGASAASSTLRSMNMSSREALMSSKSVPEPLGFDMGTRFGEAKESRVIEVEFEKGFLALTTNIYYASRQSLIEMGVPLGNEKQVSFPEPFKDGKYAEPPKGWQG